MPSTGMASGSSGRMWEAGEAYPNQAVMEHTFSPSTWEAKAGRSLSSKLA